MDVCPEGPERLHLEDGVKFDVLYGMTTTQGGYPQRRTRISS